MTAPRTVAICGSCTSRDNFASRFNPDYGRWFSVAADVFQTSIISLMSEPIEAPVPAGEKETYQERITREDVTRAFLPKLAAARPDYLVLDFFADIHFGVTRLADGRYLTDNRWMLRPTDYYAGLKEREELPATRIAADPDAYLGLWTEALDRFAAFVTEHCPQTRVIVHRGLNTDAVLVPGSSRPVRVREVRPGSRLNVRRANRLWALLDDYALDTYGPSLGWVPIDLRAEGYTSYAEHPWKPFYVHYTPDYNRRFLAELLVLDLHGDLDPDDWAQVRAIADAGHDRAVDQTTRWTPILTSQAERLRALEALSPLEAVKFALGRRIRKTRPGPKQKEREQKEIGR